MVRSFAFLTVTGCWWESGSGERGWWVYGGWGGGGGVRWRGWRGREEGRVGAALQYGFNRFL